MGDNWLLIGRCVGRHDFGSLTTLDDSTLSRCHNFLILSLAVVLGLCVFLLSVYQFQLFSVASDGSYACNCASHGIFDKFSTFSRL